MRFYVGLTDHDWFAHVAAKRPLDVNFWRPGGPTVFKALDPGGLFLFKLRKRLGGQIVGGGYFQRFDPMEPSMAWDIFGEDNGVATRTDFLLRLKRLGGEREPERSIGCVLLSEPFALPHPFTIPNWPDSIVQGRGYESEDPEGRLILDEVRSQLGTVGEFTEATAVRQSILPYDAPARGPSRTRRTRVGQGEFRLRTLENYGYTCCVTGEHTRPALEAAHIVPVGQDGRHRLDNGLCLRADVHRLFDRGLLSITPEYRVAVSPIIRELYLNGKPYYAHEGAELRSVPVDPSARPDPQALANHYETVFRRS